MSAITELSKHDVVASIENDKLERAMMLVVVHRLKQHNGNRTHAATSLGIERRTLCRWLSEWKEKRWISAGLIKPTHANAHLPRTIVTVPSQQVGSAY